MLSPMITPSYHSVCASASSDGQNGDSLIDAMASAGTPTPVVMKYSTASPRRSVAARAFRCAT